MSAIFVRYIVTNYILSDISSGSTMSVYILLGYSHTIKYTGHIFDGVFCPVNVFRYILFSISCPGMFGPGQFCPVYFVQYIWSSIICQVYIVWYILSGYILLGMFFLYIFKGFVLSGYILSGNPL